MQQIFAKLYEGTNLSIPTTGVIYLPILDTRTLNEIKVKTDEAVSGDVVFALKLNGVVITGAEAITIEDGDKIGSVTGLAVALAEGDELTLDLVSGAVSAPVTLFIATTKTVNASEITEETNKQFVTSAEKTKLSNLSNTNTGDETATSVGALINGATAKATPVDADMLGLMDSAASNILKKLSWLNLKAALKTYFDTQYQAIGGMAVNSQSTAYTAVLGDANSTILHPSSDNTARIFTIPANSSVAFPVGTILTFINLKNTVTIAITTDTLTFIGSGTTGSRTLAENGMATAVKVTSTSWVISGTNLS